jgi:hypothetical protein
VRLRSFAAGCLLAPSVEGALNIQKKCYPCARSKTSPIFPLAHLKGFGTDCTPHPPRASRARRASAPLVAHAHATAHGHAGRVALARMPQTGGGRRCANPVIVLAAELVLHPNPHFLSPRRFS